MRAGKQQTSVSATGANCGGWRLLTTSAGLMVDLGLNNSYPAWLWTHIFSSVKRARADGQSRPQYDYKHLFCSVKRGESGTVFLVLSAASGDDCLDFLAMLRFCLEPKILVVHRTTGFECSGGPTWFLGVSDHRTTVSVERWYYQILLMTKMSKTEISAEILKELSESHQKLFSTRPG